MKLQEATFMYIVNQLTTKEERSELLKTFHSLDRNGDGVLSKDELVEGYKKTMGQAEAEEEVNKIMAQVDKNNSGEIDYSGTNTSSQPRIRRCIHQPSKRAFTVETGNCI
jgi:calcium-dependent protein kinase